MAAVVAEEFRVVVVRCEFSFGLGETPLDLRQHLLCKIGEKGVAEALVNRLVVVFGLERTKNDAVFENLFPRHRMLIASYASLARLARRLSS